MGSHYKVRYQLIPNHCTSLRFDHIVRTVRHLESDKSKISALVQATGFGSSNRVMRSGVHRENFELGFSDFVTAVMVGITRPMDYFSTSLCNNLGMAFHSDLVIAENYAPAWHNQSQVNVVEFYNGGGVGLRKGQHFGEYLNQPSFDSTDKIGLLIDMESGTLSLYKKQN